MEQFGVGVVVRILFYHINVQCCSFLDFSIENIGENAYKKNEDIGKHTNSLDKVCQITAISRGFEHWLKAGITLSKSLEDNCSHNFKKDSQNNNHDLSSIHEKSITSSVKTITIVINV